MFDLDTDMMGTYRSEYCDQRPQKIINTYLVSVVVV